ncbi:MAG: glycosyltransferase family 39 protein [Planctomycetaceae bacterium]|jgi:4-amino-4-deoxy-L-arabinose transferase-like glycosyltransferase|nr:glycosyltransferase family 39 protein [Planctomycetaceae bacterium]
MNATQDFSSKRAALYFWLIVLFFCGIWILLPTSFHWSYRDDVMELQIVGKEWAIATQKLPMLPAWILETINILTNRTFAAPFLAAQLCAVLSLWSIWNLGRQVLSEKLALLGVFSAVPYWFFTLHSTKFNHNNVLITFWTLSIFFVFQAFQTRRIRYGIGAGITIGLALHAKYTAIFLILAILLFTIFHPKIRVFWKGICPYLTAFFAFLVFLPNLIWLYQHDFALLTYIQNRAVCNTSSRIFHLWYPLKFSANQIQFLIFAVAVLSPVLFFSRSEKQKTKNNSDNETKKMCGQFLCVCWGVPFVCHLLIAGVFRDNLHVEYGAAFWLFLGTWLLLRFPVDETPQRFRLSIKFLVAIEIFLVALFFYESFVSSYRDHQPRKNQFPMRELGTVCDKIWSSRFSTPCPYITGDWYLAGNAAYAMKNRPSVHFYWQGIESPDAKPTGTWSTDADVNQRGGLILWNAKNYGENKIPDYVFTRFPFAKKFPETLVLPYKTSAEIPPLNVGVAIVPPQSK